VFLTTSKPGDIFGDFNGPLKNKLLNLYEEASGKDTFMKADELKTLIASNKISIQKKYAEKDDKVKDYSRWVFLTNNITPIRKDMDDRRYMCIRCSDSKKNNKEYFDDLDSIIDFRNSNNNPCLHTLWAFFQWLKNIDVANFDQINERPNTEYDEEMREYNVPLEIRFLHWLVVDSPHKVNLPLRTLYNQFLHWNREDKNSPTEKRFAMNISQYLIDKQQGFLTKTYKMHVCYVSYTLESIETAFPSLHHDDTEPDDNEGCVINFRGDMEE
jgi:hypothetical protein